MKKRILLPVYLSCLLLLVCWRSTAQQIVTQTVNFNSSLLNITPVTANGITYSKISYPNLKNVDQPGAPQIPVQYLQLIVPPNITFSTITIQGSAFQNIPIANPVYPAQRPRTSEGGQPAFILPDPTIYNSNEPYPNAVVKYVDEGYFDGYRHIITVAVYPVQYYPLSNMLKFYSSITFTVGQTQGVAPDIYSLYRQPVASQYLYDDALVQMVRNPNDINVFYPPGTPPPPPPIQPPADWQLLSNIDVCEYMIVTSADLIPAFEELEGWKKTKGLKTCIVDIDAILSNPVASSSDVVSGIVDDAGKLREFLRYAHYYKGLIYAVLGGDQTIIPVRFSSGKINTYAYNGVADGGKIPTDLYYMDLNGDWNIDLDTFYGEDVGDKVDFESDIFVGRMLCNTELEVKNQVHKIIRYERNPGKGNYTYLGRGYMTEADEMQESDWADSIAAKFPFLSFTIKSEFPTFDAHYPVLPLASGVITDLGQYYGLVSFFNHGTPNDMSITTDTVNGCALTPPYNQKLTSVDDFVGNCMALPQDGNGLDNLDDYNHVTTPYLNYPYFCYTISCTTMPFDYMGTYPTIGEVFTCNSKAGVFAYIGNTRIGSGASAEVLEYFAKNIRVDPGTGKSPANFHIGIAHGLSKLSPPGFEMKFVKKTNNLLGCPETEMWTGTPAVFAASVSGIGTVTVNTGGVTGATVCVMSALDNGQAYHSVQKNITGSTATFTGVPAVYTVCITKHNYIPFIWNKNLTISNHSFSGPSYIAADDIHATSSVLVDNMGNVVFDAENDIILDPGFEVKQTWFEAK